LNRSFVPFSQQAINDGTKGVVCQADLSMFGQIVAIGQFFFTGVELYHTQIRQLFSSQTIMVGVGLNED
jgi:hypothetical protein